jgi:hypothetical protein
MGFRAPCRLTGCSTRTPKGVRASSGALIPWSPVNADVKAHMSSWLLLAASVVFALLAYDAWRLGVPSANEPYFLTAKGLGQDVTGVPLQELDQRRQWSLQLRMGLGNIGQSYWLWAILALVCGAVSALGFLE